MRDFDEVYRTYAAAVYRVCLRAVSRPEVAEDLTSEVFLAFHREKGLVPEEQLPAWLFTVAKRRAADFWRHHYVEQRWVDSHSEDDTVVVTPEFSLELLLERCEALKPEHRTCLILRFRHGMSRSEISEQMRLSELQVKSLLQYGLQLLRRQMVSPAGPDVPRTAPPAKADAASRV